MNFDLPRFRAQFPILSQQIHGKPLAYLDNAASVQKPKAVIDRMNEVWTTGYANVHRGLHYLSNKATTDFEQARKSVARYLSAPRVEEIILTMGGTDAINLVANSLGNHLFEEGDEIILSKMEHHSNIVPWHFLRERKGVRLVWLDVDADGQIDLDEYRSLFTQQTKLVSITGMSNVLGATPDLAKMCSIAHEADCLFMVDGCQLAAHGPVNVAEIGADFFVMTGHKSYGPNGIGVLYGRYNLLEKMPPYRGGGEMIDVVSLDHVSYNEPPHRFEAGTPPITEAIGLGAALEWVMALDGSALLAHERALTKTAMEAMAALNFIDLYGQASDKGPVIAFNINGAHPHDVSTILDRYGVAVRAGHHCCQPLMTHLGIQATARASFAAYNSLEEIDQLLAALTSAHKMLG
ncbi:MAG: SufS family cysteine desulfurase [bacterium]